jgi:hypothetical protein
VVVLVGYSLVWTNAFFGNQFTTSSWHEITMPTDKTGLATLRKDKAALDHTPDSCDHGAQAQAYANNFTAVW